MNYKNKYLKYKKKYLDLKEQLKGGADYDYEALPISIFNLSEQRCDKYNDKDGYIGPIGNYTRNLRKRRLNKANCLSAKEGCKMIKKNNRFVCVDNKEYFFEEKLGEELKNKPENQKFIKVLRQYRTPEVPREGFKKRKEILDRQQEGKFNCTGREAVIGKCGVKEKNEEVIEYPCFDKNDKMCYEEDFKDKEGNVVSGNIGVINNY